MKSLSCVRLFATPWTIAHQAPLSMGLSRQEYWSGLPFNPPGDLPDPDIKPVSFDVSCIGRWVLYHQHHLGSPSGSVTETQTLLFKPSCINGMRYCLKSAHCIKTPMPFCSELVLERLFVIVLFSCLIAWADISTTMLFTSIKDYN